MPLALAAVLLALPAQAVTSPEEHLGRPVGADFTLADWGEVAGYYRLVAEQSPHVELEVVGETTEGREFLLATIGSVENLARLAELKAVARRIADPRGLSDAEAAALLDESVPFLFVSLGMHSTECAAPQFGMELLHLLATSDREPYRSARERVVVFMPACLNPDGLDRVTRWYREHVGTPYEATGLTELYQRYAGHDNNRDWFGMALEETRVVTRLLYGELFPHVYWDVHQQGSTEERFFVPPYRDPLNGNLDAGVITAIDLLGTRALHDMQREGLTGVSTGVSYDMWWNGGNRNVPVRKNIAGLLTEAASANLGSPTWLPIGRLSAPGGIAGGYRPSNRFPSPWPGGWWRVRDVVDYEHAFARSLLGSLAREPRLWTAHVLESARRAVAAGEQGAPSAYLLPADEPNVGAARRLVEGLLLGGTEVHVAAADVLADGRRWPAGSLVVRLDQPHGRFVKDLFELQRYPEGDPPYDVAGWSLPALFGLHRVEVVGAVEGELALATDANAAVAGLGAGGEPAGPALDARDADAWRTAIETLVGGGAVALRASPAGPELLRVADSAFPTASALPRVGVYAPWSGSMSEGWLRWFLDRRYALPYERVRNEQLRAGRLGDFLDVLVLPDVSARELDRGRAPGTVEPRYAEGLDPEGALAIRSFVREGGRLVAIGGAAAWAIELFELEGLEDATEAEGFACPGSVLRTVPGPGAEGWALPDEVAVLFSRSLAWKVADGAEGVREVLRYAGDRVLLSGWIQGEEALAGAAAWVAADAGEGQVHLFGFQPQYRGWTEAAFPLLLRAVLFDGPQVQ